MSRIIGLATLAVFIGYAQTTFAQGMVAPSPDFSRPQASSVPLRLDRALKKAPCDPGEFALVVGGERVPLPDDAQMPGPEGSITAVAKAFGEVAHRFGAILAVAPPTMIVLNTHLKPPQIYEGMPTGDAVKLLAATLTPTQWSALTSAQGLGMADLTGPDQLALFRACVGTDSRKAYSTSGGAPQTVDAANDLQQARLRLGSHSDIQLPVSDHEWRGNERTIQSRGAAALYSGPIRPVRGGVALRQYHQNGNCE